MEKKVDVKKLAFDLAGKFMGKIWGAAMPKEIVSRSGRCSYVQSNPVEFLSSVRRVCDEVLSAIDSIGEGKEDLVEHLKELEKVETGLRSWAALCLWMRLQEKIKRDKKDGADKKLKIGFKKGKDDVQDGSSPAAKKGLV